MQTSSSFYYTTEIILVFVSKLVIQEVEMCKSLRRDRVVMFGINERVVIRLLCCVLMLEQDVEHLQLQSSYHQARVV